MRSEKHKKIGKITLGFVFFLAVGGYFLFNANIFGIVFNSIDWLNVFSSMIIYALITALPTIALRILLREKIIVVLWVSATALAVTCLLIMLFNTETAGDETEQLYSFAQFALTVSAPVMYSAAFYRRNREIWSAIVPALMYFLNYFIYHAIAYGLSETLAFMRYLDLFFLYRTNPDLNTLITMNRIVLMSAFFIVWGMLCILISRVTGGIFERIEDEKKQQGSNRGHRRPLI
jgi:hypothetical protein